MNTYLAKCRKGHTTTWTAEQHTAACEASMTGFLACGTCNGNVIAKSVTSKKGSKPCGSWCTEGTGASCTCECGGVNHGAAYQAGVMWALR